MLGDPVASADPDPIVAQHVIDETGKRGGGAGLLARRSNPIRGSPAGCYS
jgi:hypothetical protein